MVLMDPKFNIGMKRTKLRTFYEKERGQDPFMAQHNVDKMTDEMVEKLYARLFPEKGDE